MTPERYQQINQLFHEALALPPERREAFLAEACGPDISLRYEVNQMLKAHVSAGAFLDDPAPVPDSLIEMPTALVRGRQVGPYQILSELGRGGMGEVYLAEDRRLERRIALKLLPTHYTSDRDRVRRFEQEAKAASALNHPNIVTIHEIGTAETPAGMLYYMAAEYIAGQTLRERMKQGRISLEESLDIALQTANALQVAHESGITHRDIKPENLMIRPDGFVKVLDFGLAKLTEPVPETGAGGELPTIEKTVPGTVIGTPAYMSPEQARGLETDGRSDLWSLGIVLYEMITGTRPFQGQTTTDIIVSIVERFPAALSAVRPNIPPDLDRIVARALVKNKDERYQTAGEMASDLKKLKRQLELDAELGRRSVSEDDLVTEIPAPQQVETRMHVVQETQARAAGSIESARARFPMLPVLLGLALLAALGLGLWAYTRPKPAPAAPAPGPLRELTYSMQIQRVRDGQLYREPFDVTGRVLVEDGWKFRLRLASPQEGYLYILNEGPIPQGGIGYQFLFPISTIKQGSARIQENQPLQTGWYVIGKAQGTERLLLVWSSQPVTELESVKGVVNNVEQGSVKDASQMNVVRDFFNRQAQARPTLEEGASRKETTLRGPGDLLIHAIELEHQ